MGTEQRCGCRGVGKSSTVAMYGATKLYAILAMRVRLPICILYVAEFAQPRRHAWARSARRSHSIPILSCADKTADRQHSRLSSTSPCSAQELQKNRAQASGINGVEFFAAHRGQDRHLWAHGGRLDQAAVDRPGAQRTAVSHVVWRQICELKCRSRWAGWLLALRALDHCQNAGRRLWRC